MHIHFLKCTSAKLWPKIMMHVINLLFLYFLFLLFHLLAVTAMERQREA